MTADNLDVASGKNCNTENFPVGSFLIRRDLRPHVRAFYNFARAADDISDSPSLNAQEKISRLETFAVTLLDDNKNDIPAAVELRRSLRQTGVSPQHSLDLLTAFKRDAIQHRYRDWFDLIDYCNYSAAPVGRHVLELHGIGEKVWRANDSLCNALQIINHIQDCGDDYRKLNRVYIPQDMLAIRGARIEDLAQDKLSKELRATIDEMLDRLDTMLKDASDFSHQIADVRLSMEVSVINSLAIQLASLLRRRDPLCDNVKLDKFSIFCATLSGVVRAWL
ncbi:MAG: squalene synthase HpnC [Bdellovibrionales bacterium]